MEERISGIEFRRKTEAALGAIAPAVLSYDKTDERNYISMYAYIEQHAFEKRLFYTAVTLPLVRGIMCGSEGERSRRMAYFRHCMAVCRMLIDLHISLETHEEDVMLAAALFHVVPENQVEVTFENLKDKMNVEFSLDPEIARVVRMITRADGMAGEAYKEFYRKIQEHKLALLIRLADRGNLVQQLYGISTWSAREYIHETREYFFPLCIYAKEHYPALTGAISVMMEKMRCHIEVSEILLGRFETREQQMMQEILFLREENARIRGMIRKLETEE